MGGKKTPKAYVSENLKFFAKTLTNIKGIRQEELYYETVDYEGLENAVKMLPRKDRENIEQFWGLTGGINHCKKMVRPNKNDVAFQKLSRKAIESLRSLFKLDYMSMFDNDLKKMLECLAKKINKCGMEISDLDAIKYLMIFLVILENGPKMPFEEDNLIVDTECDPEFVFDEYTVIKEAFKHFKDSPDGIINLKIIYDMLEMFDIKDILAIKKSFRIEVPTEKIPEELRKEEIEPMQTFEKVREFKEKAFQYGCWDVTTKLIYDNVTNPIDLKEFMKCLDQIKKDWSSIERFKTRQMKIRTLHEMRTFDIYDIGGMEFSDVYEVMFLYLERNLIDP